MDVGNVSPNNIPLEECVMLQRRRNLILKRYCLSCGMVGRCLETHNVLHSVMIWVGGEVWWIGWYSTISMCLMKLCTTWMRRRGHLCMWNFSLVLAKVPGGREPMHECGQIAWRQERNFDWYGSFTCRVAIMVFDFEDNGRWWMKAGEKWILNMECEQVSKIKEE